MSTVDCPALLPPVAQPLGPALHRPLTADDAVDIWIARWLRVPRRVLCKRYGCDPRRLYEVWEQTKFAGSRDKAVAIFSARYPTLQDRIDFGPHRRSPKALPPEQMSLF